VTLPVFGGEGHRLVVLWHGVTYQFILPTSSFWPGQSPPDSFWDGPLPFPVRREAGSIEVGSILVPLAIWLLIGWIAWIVTS
jgi:hypothetical protein